MKSAPLPENEVERLRALAELQILDTIEEQAYDDLTYLAAQICETPVALVSLVDSDRQWFKSHFGLEARETPRAYAFCAHAILNDDLFVIEDAAQDVRFSDNPLVTGDPHVKFYAGAPLILGDNIRIGTLCVIDHQPRAISRRQQMALTALARQVTSQLDLRLKIAELQQLDRAKDDFIAMVNHELRTPLTSINGALSLLHHAVGTRLDAKASQLVEISCRNSARLLCIVNDVLDVTRLASGQLPLVTKPLDIAGLAQQSLELNQSYLDQCDCRAEITGISAGVRVMVHGNEQRLLQVMSNLVSNAAKFTHRGDTIRITVSEAGGNARVSVIDHGPGIPQDRRKDIFRKFSQINAGENQKLPGTGLGLHICRQLVELHGGAIGFDSEPNRQTEFYFTLPLIPPE